MIRKIAPLLLLSLLAASAGGCRKSPLSPENCFDKVTVPDAQSVAYIAFGDSLTGGYGDQVPGNGMGYAPHLSALLRRTVYCEDWGGERTAQGLQRLGGVLSAHPDAYYVLIMEGANDLWYAVSDEEIIANVEEMVLMCRRQGKEAVLLAIPPTMDGFMPRLTAINELYRGLAKRQGLLFIDTFWYDMQGRIEFTEGNWVHPNDMGYEVMAFDIASALLCGGRYR